MWAAVGGRRDEIGMAMITGVTKGRLGWQFMLETFMMTVPGWIIGLVAGALLAKPIGTAWAGGQTVAITSASVWNVIWCGERMPGAWHRGVRARGLLPANQLFEERSEVTATVMWMIRTKTSTRPWLTRPLKPRQARPSMIRSAILQMTHLPQIPLNPSILR